MDDEIKQRHELALNEMEKLLADLTAESMLSARKISQIRDQIETLTGTVEEQFEQLQLLRQELKENK